MFFYITGFGKFGNVLENPTSILVGKLPDLLTEPANASKFHLAHSEIVTTAIQDCDEALERIYARVQNCSQAEHHVIVNFGVAASRRTMDLENIGKNINDFRLPDERGN